MPISKASSSAVAPAAKGDLVVGNATNDSGVLAVGSTNQVLTVDSSTATGLKWAAAGGGSMTSLATGTLSGSSVSISSIPATYKHLYFTVANFYTSTFAELQIRLNGISSGTYTYMYFQAGDASIGQQSATSQFGICGTTNSANAYHQANFYIYDYALTNNRKIFDANFETSNAGKVSGFNSAASNTTFAIDQITILTSGGTFSAGTYTLYGVN